jgi:hypothetical protein
MFIFGTPQKMTMPAPGAYVSSDQQAMSSSFEMLPSPQAFSK